MEHAQHCAGCYDLVTTHPLAALGQEKIMHSG